MQSGQAHCTRSQRSSCNRGQARLHALAATPTAAIPRRRCPSRRGRRARAAWRRGRARQRRRERGALPSQQRGDRVAAVDDRHRERGRRRVVGRAPSDRADRHAAFLDERDRAPGRPGASCTAASAARRISSASSPPSISACTCPSMLTPRPRRRPTASRMCAGHRLGLAGCAVDQHHHLLGVGQQRARLALVHGHLPAPRRAADRRGADEDLDLVVEARRRLVLARHVAHHELEPGSERVQEPEVALVLDARAVEVGEVAPVVDDGLGVGLVEAHALARREAVRRPRTRRSVAHERISASTSSRRRSISAAL